MKTLLYSLVTFCLFTSNVWAKTAQTKLSEDSLYNLDAVWTTQEGKKVQLKDFQGHPVILAMVYLTCGFMCPTIISEVQSIEAKLDKKIRKDIRIVLVSFDPERDTPENMAAYAKKRKLDLNKWVLVTQKDEGKIRELAAVLGFKYQKTDDGEFTHSFLISAVDRDGVVKTSKEGAGGSSEALKTALNSL